MAIEDGVEVADFRGDGCDGEEGGEEGLERKSMGIEDGGGGKGESLTRKVHCGTKIASRCRRR